MKNIIPLIHWNLLQKLFALLFMVVCTLPSSAQQTITITGKINDPISDSVLLELYTVPSSYKGESHTVALSKSGEFKITAPLPEPLLAELVHGPESIVLFLQPGDQLEINTAADDFVYSAKLKGKGAHENAFLIDFTKKFEEEEDYQVLPENVHKREKEFLQFLEERRQDQHAFLNKYVGKTKVSEPFKQYVQAQIEFSYANDRLTYSETRVRAGGLKPDLSASYYEYLKQVNLNQPGATRNQTYLDFLVNYFQFKALGDRRGNAERDFYMTMFNSAKKELTGPSRDMLLTRIMTQSARFGYVPDTDAMYRELEALSMQPTYLAYARNQYQQYRKVGLGSQAPDFKLLAATGDSVSLSSFKGKMVYLGFWRNSCGICLVDQQAYHFLMEQLASKNISFIQASVEDDPKAWSAKVKEKKLTGTQVYIPNLSAKILKDYNVKVFPAYFLIGPDGTIISANARRPGHAEASKEIAMLVDQYWKSNSK